MSFPSKSVVSCAPILLSLAITAFFPVFSQTQDAAAIRPAKQITMNFAKGEKQVIHLAEGHYISQGVITLFPGDSILVEFEIVNSAPKNPKVVAKMSHPERTLELKMTQDADITMVSRNSGFAQKLTMDCYFLLLNSDFENHANMYPMEKGMGSYDSFDPKAYCIKFYDFRFAQ